MLLFLWTLSGFILGFIGLQVLVAALKITTNGAAAVYCGLIGALAAYTVMGHHLH